MNMQADMEIDLSGLRCPLPVLRVKKALGDLASGCILCAITTDAAAAEDIPGFLKQAGHELREMQTSATGHIFWIVKK